MNQEAKFYLGAQTLAQLTKFPVLFAQCRMTGNGHYEILFHEVGDPPFEKDSNRLTERYIALAEQAIREQPETWLWSNRRWKRDRLRDERLDREDARAAADTAAQDRTAAN